MNGTRCATQQDTQQFGFSLIEVLVTLGILSVALFGLAFLQAQGMQLNTSAYSRTQASILASDIIDRMRVHGGNAAAYDTSGFTPDPEHECNITDAPDPDNDRHCWYGRLQESLPNGNASISVDGSGVATVQITWQERPGGRQDSGFDPGGLTASELEELRTQQLTMRVDL